VAGLAGLCIRTGNCAGTPSVIIDTLRHDASVQPSEYGFVGDSNSQVGERYYGNLIYAGGY